MKAEHWRTDAFELWCWRRLLRVPWTARRLNQSILKEILNSPEYALEGLMLRLKLQYFAHLMRWTDSFEKSLLLGKIEGGRRRGWLRMRYLDGITDSIITVPIAQMVKLMPTMKETQIWSLGQEIPWRRKWQPTPVLLPGKFHGWKSLVGYSPWGRRVGQDWATSLSFFL